MIKTTPGPGETFFTKKIWRSTPLAIALALISAVFLNACTPAYKAPDLGGLYNSLVQNESPYRNPVILIPGLLGSKLMDRDSNMSVWGSFGAGSMRPTSEKGARAIALPMQPGLSLANLHDNVEPTGTLDRVVLNLLGYPFKQNTYAYILRVLGVGGYRDEQLADAGLVDYGERHFTCFQFGYDWRRDMVETAQALDRFIKSKREYVQQEIETRFGISNYDVKFDLVAHSMGGLVARYYLRYGTSDLPSDDQTARVTWAGARHVENLVLIGTPNSGSMEALNNLVKGFQPARLLSHYPAAVLGTMPSIYELLPRGRHGTLLDKEGRPITDIFDMDLWRENQWGLADPKADDMLQYLLPGVQDPDTRYQIALEHLQKSLLRARQFTAALDLPAKPPVGLRMMLVAGDSEKTEKTAQIHRTEKLRMIDFGPGDGTVLRSSALGDERTPSRMADRLISPISWDQVLFLFSDHLELTQNPAFTDNLLYFLLESQRDRDVSRQPY